MAAWPHSSGLEGTRVRYSAGMIWSVSMFCTHSKASAVVASRQSGAAAGGRRRGGGGGGGARAAGQRGAVKAARAGASGRPSPPDVCTPPTTEQQRRQTHILGDEALAADFARAALQVDLGLHHQARGPAPRPPAAGGPCKLHAGAAARAAGLHSGVGASLPVGCAAWRAGAGTDGAGGGAAGAEAGRLQCASPPAQPACTAARMRAGGPGHSTWRRGRPRSASFLVARSAAGEARAWGRGGSMAWHGRALQAAGGTPGAPRRGKQQCIAAGAGSGPWRRAQGRQRAPAVDAPRLGRPCGANWAARHSDTAMAVRRPAGGAWQARRRQPPPLAAGPPPTRLLARCVAAG